MTDRKFYGTLGERKRFGDGWEIYCNRRGKITRCRKCSMGGGAIGSVGRPIIMVHVRGDDEDGGGNPCKITKADDEE